MAKAKTTETTETVIARKAGRPRTFDEPTRAMLQHVPESIHADLTFLVETAKGRRGATSINSRRNFILAGLIQKAAEAARRNAARPSRKPAPAPTRDEVEQAS